MNRISWIVLIILVPGLLAAAIPRPPAQVDVKTMHNGALLSWQYQVPDSNISYNNANPLGIWAPGLKHSMGVVYDLSNYPGATLEEIDFVHYSRDKMAGPYLYRLHIYDMDSLKTIAVIDSLIAGDSNSIPRFELGVDLGSIPARPSVGIFVEGLSSPDGKYSFPALMTDSTDLVPQTSFYCADVDDPFLDGDPNFTNIYEVKEFDAGATNIIMDLWINTAEDQKVKSLSVTESTYNDGFYIFRGSSKNDLEKIASLGVEERSFLDTQARSDSEYYYAVSSVFNGQPSDRTGINYLHPAIRSVAMARLDANNDFVPDLMDEQIYVRALVNSLNFSNNTQYFAQSEHAGILIYGSDFNRELNVGDSVLVKGTITQYRGLTEILVEQNDDIMVFSQNNQVDTVTLALNEIGEAYEGMLIRVQNVGINNPGQWPAEGSNSSGIEIMNGDNTATLFIDKETDLDGWTPPEQNVDIVGILDQYTTDTPADNGYELRPRSREDFIVLTGLHNEKAALPEIFYVGQNYPNPFNPQTSIDYSIARSGLVSVTVYNALGQKVAEPVKRYHEKGHFTIQLRMNEYASGLYFYKLEAEGFSQIRKMLLLR